MIRKAALLAVASGFLNFSCAHNSKCSAHGSCKPKTQHIEAHKKIVEQFFRQISLNRIDKAFSYVDENVSWWVPGTLPFSGTKNKKQYMGIVGQITKGFPSGFELKTQSMIAEKNWVAAEVVSNGKHVNGKTYNNHYHFLIEIKNGKMIRVKEYMDTLHLHDLITP